MQSTKVILWLVHRLRRWPNNKTTLAFYRVCWVTFHTAIYHVRCHGDVWEMSLWDPRGLHACTHGVVWPPNIRHVEVTGGNKAVSSARGSTSKLISQIMIAWILVTNPENRLAKGSCQVKTNPKILKIQAKTQIFCVLCVFFLYMFLKKRKIDRGWVCVVSLIQFFLRFLDFF